MVRKTRGRKLRRRRSQRQRQRGGGLFSSTQTPAEAAKAKEARMFRDNVIAKYSPNDPNYYTFYLKAQNGYGMTVKKIIRYRMTAFEAKQYTPDDATKNIDDNTTQYTYSMTPYDPTQYTEGTKYTSAGVDNGKPFITVSEKIEYSESYPVNDM